MDVEERLSRVERYNRRLGISLIVLFALFAITGSSLVSLITFGVVRAKEFQVVGTDGQILARIGADSGGNGAFSIRNTEGEMVASMGADSDGGGAVLIRNAKGTIQAER